MLEDDACWQSNQAKRTANSVGTHDSAALEKWYTIRT